MNNPMWESRREVKKVRKKAKSWAIPGTLPLISVGKIASDGAGKRKYAEIRVAGDRTGFYDPLVAFRRQMEQLADPSKQPAQVVSVDPASVVVSECKPRGHSKSHYKSALKRMKSTCRGVKWIRMWSCSFGLGGGWFFLFADKVVRVKFSREDGWKHEIVPEGGITC